MVNPKQSEVLSKELCVNAWRCPSERWSIWGKTEWSPKGDVPKLSTANGRSVTVHRLARSAMSALRGRQVVIATGWEGAHQPPSQEDFNGAVEVFPDLDLSLS